MGKKFRTNVYIDGFNLYYSIKRMYESDETEYDPNRWREFIWLDPIKLSESFLNPVQSLSQVKYYTARVTKPRTKYHRQNAYLEALGTLDKLHVIEGEYYYNEKQCWHCGRVFPNPKEKKSDVNLATDFLLDAIDNNYDTAILVAADSDYEAPVKAVRERYPEKRLVVEFVETNFCYTLAQLANFIFFIKRDRLSNCQLPDVVELKSGHIVERPESWKLATV